MSAPAKSLSAVAAGRAREKREPANASRPESDQPSIGRKLRELVAGRQNVGNGERAVSLAAGSILALLGLNRRDLTGAGIAAVGGYLAIRGAVGHCAAYEALGVDTASSNGADGAGAGHIRCTASYLINKPAETLYSFWRNFENLPRFMSHLESVRKIDERRSHWVAKAPSVYGGTAEWDAEITEEESNKRIAWHTLPGGDVEHRGSIEFAKALGDRGTKVRVELEYRPPVGQVGRWLAKLFGEAPEQQIRDDLRRFKRLMEIGDVLTIEGQSHGTCGLRSRQ